MCFRYGIVIVGIYGKIIIISLIFIIFVEVDYDFIFVIGGLLNSVGINVRLGKSCYFIVEVDESDVFFFYLQFMVFVVINIEVDYMDMYGGDFLKVKDIFVEFLFNLFFYGYVIVCGDDVNIQEIIFCIGCNIIIYGFNVYNDVCVDNISLLFGKVNFIVYWLDKVFLDIIFNFIGNYNVFNVLVVIVVVIDEGIDDYVIVKVLVSFGGIG